ncbi:type II toxin-antitoxin system HicB family antitoxin [Luteolibacter arcticus]|uniref:Type II toxin-antitoxin system HicB family antitoxin n=1 Tax=Luteolibacter arcticus TaxID=1581411 RepID=A0ABT3GH29_9BACT|nr:type II toxin-antitoxin system HicB family antitoxin [Luteolibacter arcticus]MCW1922329.1 type II toxin-antitoxin system HicB family antitoxin [Luteolibacter arcticus]
MSTLSIRLPNSLHQHAKRLAESEGISINQLVSSALAEKLSALDAERYLRERVERGHNVAIDTILAKVPDVPPEEHDRLSER